MVNDGGVPRCNLGVGYDDLLSCESMKEVMKFRAWGGCGARRRCDRYVAPKWCRGRCFRA